MAAPNNNVPEAQGFIYYNKLTLAQSTNDPLFMSRMGLSSLAWNYNWTGTEVVSAVRTIPGQGNPNPIAFFPSHVFTQLTVGGNVIFFDPSYGTTTTGANDLQRRFNWQNANISFYAALGKIVVPVFLFKPVDTTAPAIEANVGIQQIPNYVSP